MLRGAAIWTGLVLAAAIPLALAATSPLLAWRDGVHIVAGFAGVVALALLLLQPLLIAGALPGLSRAAARRLHRCAGPALLVAALVHVGGLWITSPPDMIDALIFAAPTLFSVWGVLALWAVLVTALLAGFRRRIGWQRWRHVHAGLSATLVALTIAHALPIEGIMEPWSKAALCLLAGTATLAALLRLRLPTGAAPQRRTPRLSRR